MTTKGTVLTDFGAYDKGQKVFVQADGKIVVMGLTSGLNGDDLAVARYNSNGSLDATFDTDGKVTATSVMTINDVKLLSDGKFLTVGGSGNDFAVARYNSDGSLDTTFSADGKVYTNISSNDAAYAVAVQADGKLVVSGYASNYYQEFAVARYNADGSLDTSFSGDGLQYIAGDYAYEIATALAVQPDGKVVLAGHHDTDFALMRFDRYGNLDGSFSGDGKLFTALTGVQRAYEVKVLGSGKLLVAGTSDGDLTLVQYNTDGSIDTGFGGGDGIITTDLGGAETLNDIITQSDGKFLAVGTDGNYDLTLVRYNTDGSLDTTFSADGKVTTDLGGWEYGNSVAVQSDGKIVVAGTSDTDFALARYNADGSLDQTFGSGSPVPSPNNLPTGEVTISDTTPTENQVLTAANTLADLDTLGDIKYTWKTDSATLGEGTTYTVTAAEVGHTLTVTASYTDGGGTAESVSSASTAAVVKQSAVDPGTGTPGFSIDSGGDFSTSEAGDTAVFNVKLNAAPTRDVTLTFTSSDTTEGVITHPTFTFTAANWSVAQTFTVTGQNDGEVDGDVPYSVSAKVTTIDVVYKNIAVTALTLTNQDTPVANVETINGGDGTDILHGTSAPSYVLGKAGDDDLSGGAGNDTIYGSYGADVIFGEDGNDQLWGEQDGDYLDGGAGNDTLDGGTGADTMIGGAGNDTYILGYDAKDVIKDGGLASDVDTVIMPYQLTTYSLPAGIENGTIAPGTGASKLNGNTGDNALTGNGGNNLLNGAVGRDALFGGLGNDVLLGGTGNDTLTGGAGKDIFKFNTALKANTDKITDFSVADDTIQLDNAVFTKLTATGALNAANFVKASAAADANDYLIYNPTSGALSYDSDGAGPNAEIQVALLGVNLALTNADFVVI